MNEKERSVELRKYLEEKINQEVTIVGNALVPGQNGEPVRLSNRGTLTHVFADGFVVREPQGETLYEYGTYHAILVNSAIQPAKGGFLSGIVNKS